MKKLIATVLALVLMFSFAACGKEATQPDNVPDGTLDTSDVDVNIGMLKGPTGMGAVYLMEKADAGECPANYIFTVTSDVTDVVAKLTNGSLDIAALPTNTAANLYNKTNGDVQIIAINTLGVMYMLENGDSVNSIADLKGKTVYSNGQGANPEYTLNYILRQNGLEPGKDVEVIYKDAGEIATLMASGDAEICMLPVPYTTTILMNNQSVRVALDMNKEYEKVSDDGSVLTMGCLVARKSFIEEHRDIIDMFLALYDESINAVNGDPEAYSETVANYGITGSAAIAAAAIPDANMVCIVGDKMQGALEGYFKILFDADSASVGGSVPDEGFYYVS